MFLFARIWILTSRLRQRWVMIRMPLSIFGLLFFLPAAMRLFNPVRQRSCAAQPVQAAAPACDPVLDGVELMQGAPDQAAALDRFVWAALAWLVASLAVALQIFPQLQMEALELRKVRLRCLTCAWFLQVPSWIHARLGLETRTLHDRLWCQTLLGLGESLVGVGPTSQKSQQSRHCLLQIW